MPMVLLFAAGVILGNYGEIFHMPAHLLGEGKSAQREGEMDNMREYSTGSYFSLFLLGRGVEGAA